MHSLGRILAAVLVAGCVPHFRGVQTRDALIVDSEDRPTALLTSDPEVPGLLLVDPVSGSARVVLIASENESMLALFAPGRPGSGIVLLARRDGTYVSVLKDGKLDKAIVVSPAEGSPAQSDAAREEELQKILERMRQGVMPLLRELDRQGEK